MDSISYDISRADCPAAAFNTASHKSPRPSHRNLPRGLKVRRDLPWHAMLLISAACLVFGSGSYRATSLPAMPLTPPHTVAAENAIFTEIGRVSWYGRWHQGRRTASGERFNMYQMTAAHRTLPLGTIVRVTNPLNGKTVKVRINDRGPYVKGRVLDLSAAAAKALGISHQGTAKLQIETFASDQLAS